jgi:alkyldihydroxyacetonephosphate synthase
VTTLDPTVVARLREILGPDAVEASEVAREAYARDLSALGHLGFAARREDLGAYRVPDLVARPTTVAQVQDVVRLAQELEFNLVPWGAGSGVCGGSVATQGGVILDLKGLARIRRIDTVSQLVEVEAGVNGELLEERLQQEGLTLGHFPSSITCSTVGGWLAARGAGQLSTRYGKVEDMTVAVEVVLPDGSLVSTPVAPRAATGPDWNQVFIGSEGVLGVIVACTLRVHPLPARRRFASFEFPQLSDALEAIRVGLQQGARPAAVRLYDPLDTARRRARGAPPGVPVAAEPILAPALGVGAESAAARGQGHGRARVARATPAAQQAHPTLAGGGVLAGVDLRGRGRARRCRVRRDAAGVSALQR